MKFLLKILKPVATKIFGLSIFDKLKGYKTIVLAFLTMALGLLIYFKDSLSSGIGDIACNTGITFLCNVTDSHFYGSIIIAIGFLQKMIRLVTETPIPALEIKKDEKE